MIDRSFVVCLVGVWWRNFEPVVCVYGTAGHTTLRSTPYRQLENQVPKTTGGNQLHNTLELLMMGIMVPETCWASNKICNKKKHLLHLVGILFPHTKDDARSKSLQKYKWCLSTLGQNPYTLKSCQTQLLLPIALFPHRVIFFPHILLHLFPWTYIYRHTHVAVTNLYEVISS
jgi:hypothetical protein